MARKKVLNLKLTDDEHRALESYAMQTNLTLADAARKILGLILPISVLREGPKKRFIIEEPKKRGRPRKL